MLVPCRVSKRDAFFHYFSVPRFSIFRSSLLFLLEEKRRKEIKGLFT